MSRYRCLNPPAACLAIIGLVLAAGCSEKMWITQVPDFYTPDLKAIAIAGFRNQTNWRGAGDIISDQLAAALMANRTYKVFNRNDLKTLMDESDLRIALGGDSSAAAGKLKKLTQVQAVLIGTITTYGSTTNSQPRTEPVYATDRNGNTYVAGYRSFVHTRNEGNVSVTAVLLRTSDGSTIHATPEPAWARVWAEGSPPEKDAQACLAEAAASVVGQLLATFAPIRKQISVDPSKALRTAADLYDNKWAYSDDFKVTDDKMHVVVELPANCDRNTFRLAVVRKGERQDLADQVIKWDKNYKGFGYLFNPKQIAEKGGGPGVFEVKFYSGPEPIMRHTFRIR